MSDEERKRQFEMFGVTQPARDEQTVAALTAKGWSDLGDITISPCMFHPEYGHASVKAAANLQYSIDQQSGIESRIAALERKFQSLASVHGLQGERP